MGTNVPSARMVPGADARATCGSVGPAIWRIFFTAPFAVHGGELYVSEWPNARVYRLDGDDWVFSGRLGEELE